MTEPTLNAERLLELYDRVADAPDAINRLRRFVLDLAVRGKLVKQHPNDEPASDLLKRIKDEKERLAKDGEFREPRNAIDIKREELPFAPPSHWAWCRLIDIARPSYGFAFPSSQFNNDKRGMPLIRIRDISRTDTEAYFEGDFDSAYLVRPGDYLVGMDGSFNLHRWQGPDGLLNQRVLRINGWRCGVDPEYVKVPLQMVLDYLHGDTSLTTVKHLSAKQVNGLEVPLPPLAEQHRIVAKVEELMALLDRLEATHTAAETARDCLTTASLARLTAPDTTPEEFPAHARFALDTLSALTTRADQIQTLRQRILNLAVRGKLVAQDPTDEPAVNLLVRVSAERDALMAAGDARLRQPPSGPDEAEVPYELPAGWAWCRIGSLVMSSDAGWSPRTENHARESDAWGVIKVSAVSWDYFNPQENKQILPGTEPRLQAKIRKGDFLISRANTSDLVARAVLVSEEPINLMMSDKIVRLNLSSSVNPRFLCMANNHLDSSREYYAANATGVSSSMKNVSRSVILNLPIPLPPLAEQDRIVSKADELMTLCDRLKASLASADTTKQRLLESLLREALPHESRDKDPR